MLPASLATAAEQLCRISKSLRRDRELAFYGSEDLTPSECYGRDDAEIALRDARYVIDIIAPYESSQRGSNSDGDPKDARGR